jgi:hypothetical protein
VSVVPSGSKSGKKFGQGKIAMASPLPSGAVAPSHVKLDPVERSVSFFIPLHDVLRTKDGMVSAILFLKNPGDTTPSAFFTEHNGVELHYTYRVILHQVDQKVSDSDVWVASKVMMGKVPYKTNPVSSPSKDLLTDSRTTVAEVECCIDEAQGYSASDAFDQAIEIISDFQQAYHLATKESISLVSRKNVPALIPMLSERQTGELVPSIFLTGPDTLANAAGRRAGVLNPNTETISEEQDESIRKSLLILQTGLLGKFIDVQREALVAYRSGNAILASALFGLAAELLVKEIVTILLWESAVPLREAGRSLKALKSSRSFVSEAQKQLAALLGGSWTKDTNEAYRSWREDVALLRNSSMHEGYRPTEVEIQKAASAYEGFQRYLLDALSGQAGKYPVASTLWSGGTSFDIPAFELRQKLDNWRTEIDRLDVRHEGDLRSSVLHALVYSIDDVRVFVVDEGNRLAMKLPVELQDLGFDRAKFVGDLASHGAPAPYHVLLKDSEVPDSVDASGNSWEPLYQAFPETNSLTFKVAG